MPHNTEEIRHAYESKYKLNRENQVILLMITDGKKWHYLAIKSLSALIKGITAKHDGDFYCLNCFHSYTTENKLKKHKDLGENRDYCYVEMPREDNEMKYNHGEKSMKIPFVVSANLESFLKNIDTSMIITEARTAWKTFVRI